MTILENKQRAEWLITFGAPRWKEKSEAIKAIPGRYGFKDSQSGEFVWHIPFEVLPKGLTPGCSYEQQLTRITALFNKYVPKNVVAGIPEGIGEIPPMPELQAEDKAFLDANLKRPLFHYQEQGVAFNLQHRHTIIGDDMGLGKTSQAVASVVAAKCRCTLVICPATVKEGWKREFETVAGWKEGKDVVIMKPSIKKTWHQYHNVAGVKVFITNYESIKSYFVTSVNDLDKGGKKKVWKVKDVVFNEWVKLFDCIIIDESHKIKDSSTAIAKFCGGIAYKKEYIFLLTGTPIVNKPKDIWSQLVVLGYGWDDSVFGGKTYFFNRYCGGLAGTGATNLNELQYRLKSNCFYRRNAKEVRKDLPDKIRQLIYCDITTRAEYEHACGDLAKYLEQFSDKTPAEIEKALNGEIMVRIQNWIKISAKGKIQQVIEHIEGIHEAGEKYVLFCHHGFVGLEIMRHFPQAVAINGTMDLAQRQRSIDTFRNNPETNLIVCSIQASGTGVDGLQHAAHMMGFIEFRWHAAVMDQCEARIDRTGQKEACIFHYFIGTDTFDERMYEIIETKRNIGEKATGSKDTADVDIVRDVIGLFRKSKSIAA